MLVPGFFDDAFVNTVFDDFFGRPAVRAKRPEKKTANALSMRADVQEFADRYVIDYELPGFDKSDIMAELKDGYLIVKAEKNVVKDSAKDPTETANATENAETDKSVMATKDATEVAKDAQNAGKYIRRERYYGSYERSFYVGDQLKQEDIQAAFENGILSITVPKKEAVPQVEEKHYINIA